MYGKHFESMYEGSMYGSGVAVFAVWGYVIAKAICSRVELNPRLLANTLGGTVEEVDAAINFLASPDPHSRNKEHEGRRLIKEGEFQYFVPSWQKYRDIKDEISRREYNRIKQAEHRAKLSMTDKEKAAYDEGKSAEYFKRKKSSGLKKSKEIGQKEGAIKALQEGFKEAQA